MEWDRQRVAVAKAGTIMEQRHGRLQEEIRRDQDSANVHLNAEQKAQWVVFTESLKWKQNFKQLKTMFALLSAKTSWIKKCTSTLPQLNTSPSSIHQADKLFRLNLFFALILQIITSYFVKCICNKYHI